MIKHEFALFFEQLSSFILTGNKEFVFSDEIYHRLINVLRLSEKEVYVLFDGTLYASFLVKLIDNKKRILRADLLRYEKIAQRSCRVTLYVSLLKKEAFEQVAYFAGEIGMSSITPIISAKVQRKWGGEKELFRLKKIAISGCEQAKNFSIPEIKRPLEFNEFISKKEQLVPSTKKVFFYENGKPLIGLLTDLSKGSYQEIAIFIGPEGGVVETELSDLEEAGFKLVRLTPTTLRAVEAVSVGCGAVVSIVHSEKVEG